MEDKRLLGSVSIDKSIIADVKKHVTSIRSFGKHIEKATTENTTQAVETMLAGAIHLDASDIHIEPQEKDARLRVRVDGVLQDAVVCSTDIYHHILSRIKLLSKIKLNVQDTPQDGRFTVAIDDLLIEIRTSTLPAEYGEAVVMRILNPRNFRQLDTLGLRQDLYQAFEKEIKKPNGLIVVTGPTGSGKTTTLYAFLMKLQNSEMKIITIEDPIEYHLKGVEQTQVAPEKGYGFAEGLRSIVRQDPDVILVGEIRDLQTAQIALQAALTGHLVLTTLHTNDAAGTIPRLLDLGEKASSIAPALNMAIAQRLVRKVCQQCSNLNAPSPEELAEIKKGLKGVKKDIIGKDIAKVKIAKASEKGCKACNLTGYKGRKGLYELFLNDEHMEKLILTNPAASAMKSALVKRGMVTIYQSGLIEVINGQTTLEEVKRVVEADG